MLRGILGVIVGFIVYFLVMFCLLTGAYLAIGTERAFQAGSYTPSPTWMVLMVIALIISTILGGMVCAMLSRSSMAPKVLAILLFAIGILAAIGSMGANKPAVDRTGNVSNFEAMQNARTPMWFTFASPLIGAIGVLVGAGLRKNQA